MKKVQITKIYNDAADKNVAATVLYANDGKLYFEKEFTNQVSKAELENLFVKGLIIVDEKKQLVKPVTLTDNGSNAVVSIPAIEDGALTVAVLASAEEVTE